MTRERVEHKRVVATASTGSRLLMGGTRAVRMAGMKIAVLAVAVLWWVGSMLAAEPATSGEWRQRAIGFAAEIADEAARAQAYSDLFNDLARVGDLEGARGLIASIGNPQLRIYAHGRLAKLYRADGDEARAAEELKSAADEALGWDSNFGHAHVIPLYFELGRAEEAVAFAKRIGKEYYRQVAMRGVAIQFALRGDLAKAEDVVKHLLPENWEQSVWTGAVMALADVKKVEDAKACLARVKDDKKADPAMYQLVGAMLMAGRAEEAGEVAARITDERMRAEALASVAAAAGPTESVEAMQLRFEQCKTREEKLALGEKLFARCVEAENVEAAEAVVDGMIQAIKESPREARTSKFGTFDDSAAMAGVQVKSLMVATLLAKSGDREGALERVTRARNAVTAVPEKAGLAKAMVAMQLVQTQIAIEDFAGARESLKGLGDAIGASMMVGQVAASLVKSGDVKAGLEVSEMIEADVFRGLAYAEVVKELLKANEVEGARTLLGRLGEGQHDAHGFRAAGKTMAELGRQEELMGWVKEMKSALGRTYLSLGAAEGL